MKKKILAILLAAVMAVGLLPAAAFADDVVTTDDDVLLSAPAEPAASGTCGENVTWSYSDGVLTIEGTGPMYDYGWAEDDNSLDAYKDAPWHDFCEEISTVTIGSGVTAIGKSAFEDCGMTSVSIPGTVTTIGAMAFSWCGNLTDVIIPEGVTTIGAEAFAWCDALTSVTIPGSVAAIGDSAFTQCVSLTGAVIPEGVASIGAGVFSSCESMTSVSIPASVTSIEAWAFYGCENLTDIYYGGNENQWKQISIEHTTADAPDEDTNAPLLSATIHYTEDEEPTEPENPFTDVPAGEWYADSVLWAVEKGITTGTDDGTTFEPDRDCHDIEILTMLYRADSGESQGNGGDMARAAAWALENGLISEDYDVTAECTRATAVWYIWKVLGADDTAPAYSFTDVEADANYAAAVNWAVATGVTNGSEDGTTFSPGDPCSRGMIVTFLYRAYANSVSE